MNKDLLDKNSINEFKKLINNTENINNELNCYAQLVKELLIHSYCAN